MSRARKHVIEEVRNSFPEPDVDAGEEVGRVIEAHGNDRFTIAVAGGEEVLCTMESRFKKLIWIKRGDHVIVGCQDTVDERRHGIITKILYYDRQVNHVKSIGLWPDDFDDGGGGHNDDEAPEVADDDVEAAGDGEAAAGEGSDSGDSLDRDLAHLLSNPNHRNVMASYSYSDDDN